MQVTAHLSLPDAASQVPGPETLQARSQALPRSMVGVLVAVLLLMLVVGALGWVRHRRSLKLVQVRGLLWSRVGV